MTERLNVEASVNTIFDVSQMSSVVLGWVDRLTLKSTIVGDPESPGKTSLCFRKKIDILSLFIKSSDYIDGLVYYQSMERLVRFKEEAVVHTRETCFYADSKTVGMQDEEEIWSLNSSDLPSYKETRRTLTRKFSLLVKGELDTAAQVHWAIPIIFNEKVLKLRNGEEEKSLEPLEVSGGLFFFFNDFIERKKIREEKVKEISLHVFKLSNGELQLNADLELGEGVNRKRLKSCIIWKVNKSSDAVATFSLTSETSTLTDARSNSGGYLNIVTVPDRRYF